MTLQRVKTLFELKIKTAGGLSLPDTDMLSILCDEACRHVAVRCSPVVLLRLSPYDGESILRTLGNGFLVVTPEYPDFTSDVLHLMIDEELNYAVINKMAALYSRDAKDIVRFENEATQAINLFKANFTRLTDGYTQREIDDLTDSAEVINTLDVFDFLSNIYDKADTWEKELTHA